ncbi:MAG: recombination mediator RecR [Patescibacteria group bacterium]
MKIPRAISLLIDSFQKLPGIGPKSAQRLTYYLLHVPQIELDNFSDAISHLKKDTTLCSICRNIGEEDPCLICSDMSRDISTILVVEQPLDVLAFEKTGKYKGLYHVLHGAINPLENIGPDEIYISDLIERVKKDKKLKEIIIATNPTMEGEATAMYINKKLKVTHEMMQSSYKLKITRLGMGIPTGADLEYADEVTLSQALSGRRDI